MSTSVKRSYTTRSVQSEYVDENTLPYPNGWFVIARSVDIRRKQVKTFRVVGQDIIVYRTEQGIVNVTDPYCPHLGAHFAHGGSVNGEQLICPFHGFQFRIDGKCTKTGYGTKPSPRAVLKTWPVCEQNGLILIYYHQERQKPDWNVPLLDMQEWTSMRYQYFDINDHPQETTENSVDIGHFAFIHKYTDVMMPNTPIFENHYMSTQYSFRKPFPGLLRLLIPNGQKIEIQTHIYGLGYSLVEVWIPGLRYRLRMWVLPTPIAPQKVRLHLGMAKKKSTSFLLRMFDKLLSRIILIGFIQDVKQDFKVWQHKIYIPQPALSKGDGPIWEYRQWAQQFYSNPN